MRVRSVRKLQLSVSNIEIATVRYLEVEPKAFVGRFHFVIRLAAEIRDRVRMSEVNRFL